MEELSLTKEQITSAVALSMAVYEKDVSHYLTHQQSLDHQISKIITTIDDKTVPQRFLMAESEKQKTVYISFRGTDNLSDVVLDSKFRQVASSDFNGKFHSGFYQRSQVFKPELLFEYLYLSKKEWKIVFCGHSMGGSVAAVSCLHVMNSVSEEYRKFIFTVGFGAPLFADPQARNTFLSKIKLSSNFIWFVNPSDFVPASLTIMQYVFSNVLDYDKPSDNDNQKVDLETFIAEKGINFGGLCKAILRLAGLSKPETGAYLLWDLLKKVFATMKPLIMEYIKKLTYAIIGTVFTVNDAHTFSKFELQSEQDTSNTGLQRLFKVFFESNSILNTAVSNINYHCMSVYTANLTNILVKKQRNIPLPETLNRSVLSDKFKLDVSNVVSVGQDITTTNPTPTTVQEASQTPVIISCNNKGGKELHLYLSHPNAFTIQSIECESHTHLKRNRFNILQMNLCEVSFVSSDAEQDFSAVSAKRFKFKLYSLFKIASFEFSLAVFREHSVESYNYQRISVLDPITLLYFAFRKRNYINYLQQHGKNIDLFKAEFNSLTTDLKKFSPEIFESCKDFPEEVNTGAWFFGKKIKFSKYLHEHLEKIFPQPPNHTKRILLGLGIGAGFVAGALAGVYFLPALFTATITGNSAGVVTLSTFGLVVSSSAAGISGAAAGGTLSALATLTLENRKFNQQYMDYLCNLAERMSLRLDKDETVLSVEEKIATHLFTSGISKEEGISLNIDQLGTLINIRKSLMKSGLNVVVTGSNQEQVTKFYTKLKITPVFFKTNHTIQNLEDLNTLQSNATMLEFMKHGGVDIIYIVLDLKDCEQRNNLLSYLEPAEVNTIVICFQNCEPNQYDLVQNIASDVWYKIGINPRNFKSSKLYCIFLNDQPNYQKGIFDMEVAYGFILDLLSTKDCIEKYQFRKLKSIVIRKRGSTLSLKLQAHSVSHAIYAFNTEMGTIYRHLINHDSYVTDENHELKEGGEYCIE